MGHKIIPISELTDSREMLYAKEPHFFLIFILLIVALLGAAFAWSWYSEIDIVVKAPGIVRPAETISSVTTVISGKVSEIKITDGQMVKKDDVLFVLDTKLEMNKKGSLNESVAILQRDIGRLRRLYSAIISANSDSLAKNDTITYTKYMTYKYTLDQLTLAYGEAKTNYENEKKMFESNYSSKSKYETIEREYKKAEIALKKHTADTLNSINTDIESKQLQLKSIRDQIDQMEIGMESTVIRSPIEGKVELVQKLNVGDMVAAGSELTRVIPFSPDYMHVEIYLPVEDIGKIKLNHHVEYRFAGYDYRDYNTGTGNISFVPADMTLNQNGAGFYRLIAKLDKSFVLTKTGRRGDVKIGMNAEVRIITGKQQLFTSFLKKLNFWSDVYEPSK